MQTPQRITKQRWPQDSTPLVSVVCWTYNHEKFIEQCINGLLMQETDFPVEIIIHDDASTDRTQEIIRAFEEKHPQLFRNLLQKVNRMSQGGDFIGPIIAHARGSYVALCDGDDFWTHPRKLQMQVALLEHDLSLSMCGHAAVNFDQEKGVFTDEYPPLEARSPIHGPESFVKFQCFTPTASVVLRANMIARLPDSLLDLKMGDWTLFLLTSLNGPVGFIDRVMSCYRIHGGGVWTSMSVAAQCAAVMEMWERMLPLLPGEVAALAQEGLNNLYLSALSQSVSGPALGRWWLAWRWLWSSVRSGSLHRREISYVLGRLCPLLLRFRRDPSFTSN